MSSLAALPTELLCRVFFYSSNDEHYLQHLAPWRICSVSKTWRDIAVLYGPLWATISVVVVADEDIPESEQRRQSQENSLALQLLRARMAPLSITIVCARLTDIEGTIAILLPSCSQWQSLTLGLPLEVFSLFSPIMGQLTSLRTLHLCPKLFSVLKEEDPGFIAEEMVMSWDIDEEAIGQSALMTLFEVAPSLSDLAIGSLHLLGEVRLPWQQIAVFSNDLPHVFYNHRVLTHFCWLDDDCQPDDAYRVLSKMPNIKCVNLQLAEELAEETVDALLEPLTLPHLHTLTIRWVEPLNAVSQLNLISSNLKCLTLIQWGSGKIASQFIRQSLAKLDELTLVEYGHCTDWVDVLPLLEATISLKSLELRDRYLAGPLIQEIVLLLTKTEHTGLTQSGHQALILPELASLSIQGRPPNPLNIIMEQRLDYLHSMIPSMLVNSLPYIPTSMKPPKRDEHYWDPSVSVSFSYFYRASSCSFFRVGEF